MVSLRQLPRLVIVSYDPRRPLGVGSFRIKFAVITEFPAKKSVALRRTVQHSVLRSTATALRRDAMCFRGTEKLGG